MIRPENVTKASDLLRERSDLEIERAIEAFIGNDPTPSRLTEAALALGQPGIFLPLVDALLHDPTGTTFEENPAFMLQAEDRTDGGTLESLHALTIAKGADWDARVHVWMEGRRLTEDLHTHRGDFGSVVLTGKFGDEVFVKTEEGEGEPMLEWSYDRLYPLGQVALRSVGERVFSTGQYHTMPHTLIHSAQVNPDGISSTVVVRKIRKNTSLGYTDGPRTSAFPVVVPVDGIDTLRRLRKKLAET